MVKKLMSFCVAAVLSIPMFAFAQNSSQSGSQSQPNAQNQSNTQTSSQSGQASNGKHKQQKMTGTVSNSGKTFTSDKNNQSYTVDNPDSLQSQEGQHVSVILAVDPDTNTVHIIQLAAPGPPPQL